MSARESVKTSTNSSGGMRTITSLELEQMMQNGNMKDGQSPVKQVKGIRRLLACLWCGGKHNALLRADHQMRLKDEVKFLEEELKRMQDETELASDNSNGGKGAHQR